MRWWTWAGRSADALISLSPRSKASPSPIDAHTLKVLPERLRLPAANEPSVAKVAVPALSVYVLGPFRALLDGQAIEAWPNCRAKAIFKYLVLNRRRPVARVALMERFWPEAEPEAARNNLNVAIHRLRRVLGRDGFPFVLFSECHDGSSATCEPHDCHDDENNNENPYDAQTSNGCKHVSLLSLVCGVRIEYVSLIHIH